MIEWFLFVMVVALTLLVAQCIGAMGEEDDADSDVWRALGGGDEHE